MTERKRIGFFVRDPREPVFVRPSEDELRRDMAKWCVADLLDFVAQLHEGKVT